MLLSRLPGQRVTLHGDLPGSHKARGHMGGHCSDGGAREGGQTVCCQQVVPLHL